MTIENTIVQFESGEIDVKETIDSALHTLGYEPPKIEYDEDEQQEFGTAKWDAERGRSLVKLAQQALWIRVQDKLSLQKYSAILTSIVDLLCDEYELLINWVNEIFAGEGYLDL